MIRDARYALAGALSILAGAWVAAACSSSGSPAGAPAQAGTQKAKVSLRVVSEPHSQITGGSVIGIVGFYNGCSGYGFEEPWALATPGNDAPMAAITGLAGPQPLLNDNTCQLQIVYIYTTASTSYSDGYATTNQPTALNVSGLESAAAGEFLSSPVGFTSPLDDGGTGPLSFYANAESTVIDSSASFEITMLVGDDPNLGSTSTTATTVVTGSVGSVGDVLAPDYSVDFTNLELGDNPDAGVDFAGGTINLDFNTQGGETYLPVPGQDVSAWSFQQIDSMFSADFGSESAIPEDAGTFSIPATSFVNVGDTLPETSSVVVQHIDSASDVTTYEILAITFNPSGS